MDSALSLFKGDEPGGRVGVTIKYKGYSSIELFKKQFINHNSAFIS
jgi:hypothetical protein